MLDIEKAFAKIDFEAEKLSEVLNKCSDEIERLEGTLQTKGIYIDFSFELEDSPGSYIAWEKFGKKNKFRLLFIDNNIVKPLLGCDFKTRMKVHRILPQFISEFTSIIKNERERLLERVDEE